MAHDIPRLATAVHEAGLTFGIPNSGREAPGCRRDPEDVSDDSVSDAAGMIVHAMAQAARPVISAAVQPLRVDDDCPTAENAGFVEFTFPQLTVRVRKDAHADVMARDAVEEYWCHAMALERILK